MILIICFMLEKSQPIAENELGELPRINKLIIMDDVSGLADKSEEFSNFLTVSRTYGFSCVCFSYYLSRKAKLGNDHGSNT